MQYTRESESGARNWLILLGMPCLEFPRSEQKLIVSVMLASRPWILQIQHSKCAIPERKMLYPAKLRTVGALPHPHFHHLLS